MRDSTKKENTEITLFSKYGSVDPNTKVTVHATFNEYGKSHIFIHGDMLPRVWEESVIATYEYGEHVLTQYDTMGTRTRNTAITMVVNTPWAEPSIHKAIPGGLAELETYRLEVCEGLHEEWIDHNDPQKWQYSYSERIFSYPGQYGIHNQFNAAADKLIDDWTSRQANISIWDARTDNNYAHPPCLQIMDFTITKWCGEFYLNTTVYMRSNCAMKAAAMNMFAFNSLAEKMADKIAETNPTWLDGAPVNIGSYTHHANSYHIYGNYIANEEYDTFKKLYDDRDFSDRAYSSYDKTVKEIFQETRDKHYAK